MKTGFVSLYTTNAGLQMFIATGCCTAVVHSKGTWHNQIMVPREGIKNFALRGEDDLLPEQIQVNLQDK